VTVFELLVIAIALCAAGAVGASLYFLSRGNRRRAGRVGAGLAVSLAIYLGIVAAVALTTKQRVVPMGEDQCFDDLCVAVVKSEGKENRYEVTLRISSRARRRVMRAPDLAVYLIDGAGREYRDSEAGPGRPLTDFLRPGESFETVRIFTVLRGVSDLSLVVSHGGWPGWFIIGENNSLLHKPTVVPLRR